MPLPPALSAIIDEDLAQIRAVLGGAAPGAEIVLAGSLAFDEPWAQMGSDGRWVLESDYDLYLMVSGAGRSRSLARSPALRGLEAKLGLRAPVDLHVIWRPLFELGLVGMVGRRLDSGVFVDCALDPGRLQRNQTRKALLRLRLLAPRETQDRSRYQIVKASIEALRAAILQHSPELDPRDLFSLRANLRWLRAHPQALGPGDGAMLQDLLQARLDLGGPGPDDRLMAAAGAWLERFAAACSQARHPGTPGPPRPSARGALYPWLCCLRQGLIPDPRADFDAAILAVLADPVAARLAMEPGLGKEIEGRLRHLIITGWRPRRPGALLHALDAAMSNPMSAKGERHLFPRAGDP